MVRVRFAPSPTGRLHIGGARTALFNWLFARGQGGAFILRIEDTDRERSKGEYEEDILHGLRAVGLSWDELYRQSERGALYRRELERLLENGSAYHCFCTKEALEAARGAERSVSGAPRYAGTCAGVSREEAARRVAAGERSVIRLRVPPGVVVFTDTIRGEIRTDLGAGGDFVIAKSLDEPLYNFAVVVDDEEMRITHIIRGEDHIPNTPKQLAIARALGYAWESMHFAHLPLILAPDRSKMSKRYGDTALGAYLADGYLPEAILNFVAYLGWHPEDDREIMRLDELTSAFSLERVQKAGAIFAIEKLNWLNRQYIGKVLTTEELLPRAQAFLPSERRLTAPILEAVRGRIEKLSDLPALAEPFFTEPAYETSLLFFRGERSGIRENLERLREALAEVPEERYAVPELTDILARVVPPDARGPYLSPLRVALSGREQSPTPYELLAGLGKPVSLARIERAIALLSSDSA